MAGPKIERQDTIIERGKVLSAYLKIISPVSQYFTGSDIKMNPNSRAVKIPDIRVDDYIVDADISRIGADHYSGSEFTGKWINGQPPIEWRTYSMSRRRSFGYVIFDDQVRYGALGNLQQEYVGRKMNSTVLRDHDKYCMLAAVSGHMTGKLVPRLATDSPRPQTENVHLIANTGNAADYKWIAEPGEHYDNEIQPSFAAIKGMYLDKSDLGNTITQLNIMFSDNWYDSNYSNNDRFLLITAALEAVIAEKLSLQAAGTESGYKLIKDADVSGTNHDSFLGSYRGWKLVKIHPEFMPKVFTDNNLVVDPMADTTTGSRKLRQVVALAAYKNAIQTYDYFSDTRSSDGGTRFKGTEYVHEFSYDTWVIEQFSEGVIPLFLPETGTTYKTVEDSFANVAAMVTAARAQKSVAPSTYPINPIETHKSRPEWFHAPYNATENLTQADGALQVAGDMSHNQPTQPAK